MLQNQRSKSRSNLVEGSPDSSSLGSGSFMDGNDHDFSKKSGTVFSRSTENCVIVILYCVELLSVYVHHNNDMLACIST